MCESKKQVIKITQTITHICVLIKILHFGVRVLGISVDFTAFAWMKILCHSAVGLGGSGPADQTPKVDLRVHGHG